MYCILCFGFLDDLSDVAETIDDTLVTNEKPLTKWTVEDVCQWLGELGLNQYTPNFSENEIDGTELLTLKHETLEQSIGISKYIVNSNFSENQIEINGTQPLTLKHDTMEQSIVICEYRVHYQKKSIATCCSPSNMKQSIRSSKYIYMHSKPPQEQDPLYELFILKEKHWNSPLG